MKLSQSAKRSPISNKCLNGWPGRCCRRAKRSNQTRPVARDRVQDVKPWDRTQPSELGPDGTHDLSNTQTSLVCYQIPVTKRHQVSHRKLFRVKACRCHRRGSICQLCEPHQSRVTWFDSVRQLLPVCFLNVIRHEPASQVPWRLYAGDLLDALIVFKAYPRRGILVGNVPGRIAESDSSDSTHLGHALSG